jgi:hypothetical protein
MKKAPAEPRDKSLCKTGPENVSTGSSIRFSASEVRKMKPELKPTKQMFSEQPPHPVLILRLQQKREWIDIFAAGVI